MGVGMARLARHFGHSNTFALGALGLLFTVGSFGVLVLLLDLNRKQAPLPVQCGLLGVLSLALACRRLFVRKPFPHQREHTPIHQRPNPICDLPTCSRSLPVDGRG